MSDLLTVQVTAILVYASLWFLAAQRLKRYDIADIAWGLGFIFLILVGQFSAPAFSIRILLVQLMVVVWGLRLAAYIWLRNRGREEDPRYRKWRQDWGSRAPLRAYFQIFLLQGLLAVIILSPATYLLAQKGPDLNWLDVLGAVVWLGGILFESIGDLQLSRFKRKPENRGRFITSGLWAYSRHPNYFGEVMLWWGLWLIVCSVPGGWMTVWGPVTITVLILFVSGIPLLEKKYEKNDEYEAYRQRTSAFIPLPPKR